MKPAAFDYLRAGTLEEALAVLDQAGSDACILAGGQSLVPMLNMRLARPRLLIDITRLAELATIELTARSMLVPAAVRQADLERHPELESRAPLLARALPWLGHLQTRAQGTVCGSIAHADPSGELPLCLVALGGSVTLRRRGGTRTLPAADFFTGAMSTARRDSELLTAVTFPRAPAGTGYGFREVGPRHGDFAIVAIAAVAGADGLRIAVGGVGDVPALRDLPDLDASALADALNDLAWDLDARDDLHASARYRRELVRRLGTAAIGEARACRG